MGVIYTPGQVLTRGDLDLYLTNSDNHPANAFSITYAIYYVDPDTSSEVLVGPSSRDPVNPAVGEYYVAIQIPSSAVVGDYRVRWTLQETSGSQTYTVVQEFGVVSPGTDTGASVLSACEAELIYRLRIMLRDNCVGAEELVELDVNGVRMIVRMDDLYAAVHEVQSSQLKESFLNGMLRVCSVSPTGQVEWKRVVAVQRAQVGPESIHEVSTEHGPLVLTGGHRVFLSPTTKTEAENLRPGDQVLGVQHGGGVMRPTITATRRLPSREWMYDLTAEDWHNFVLYRSNVVISNSPDKNYRFRPPEHEGKVGCYNQVFGYIWTDEELLEYLKITLDKWNMQPPKTEHLCSLNAVCKQEPSTRAALLWGAVVHAAMALSFNWVSEEFSTAGDTMVQVLLPDGSSTSMRIADLYDICYGGDV